MQAILLEDIKGLGTGGAVVNVARGYMRNYLEPRSLAEFMTHGPGFLRRGLPEATLNLLADELPVVLAGGVHFGRCRLTSRLPASF